MPHSPLREGSRFQRFGRFRRDPQGFQQSQSIGQQDPFQFQQQQLPPVFDPRQQFQPRRNEPPPGIFGPNQRGPIESSFSRPSLEGINIADLLQGQVNAPIDPSRLGGPQIFPPRPDEFPPGFGPQIQPPPALPLKPGFGGITPGINPNAGNGPQIQPPPALPLKPGFGGITPPIDPRGGLIGTTQGGGGGPPPQELPGGGLGQFLSPSSNNTGIGGGLPNDELIARTQGGGGAPPPQDLQTLLQLIQAQGGGFDPSNAFGGLVQNFQRFEQPAPLTRAQLPQGPPPEVINVPNQFGPPPTFGNFVGPRRRFGGGRPVRPGQVQRIL